MKHSNGLADGRVKGYPDAFIINISSKSHGRAKMRAAVLHDETFVN
jgi:hypothetical protein